LKINFEKPVTGMLEKIYLTFQLGRLHLISNCLKVQTTGKPDYFLR